MTAREANELSAAIKSAMLCSAGSRRRENAEPVPYLESDLFHLQLQRQLLLSKEGRELLRQPVANVANHEMAARLERHFKTPADQLPCSRIVEQSAEKLAQILQVSHPEAARRFKLECLRLPMNDTRHDRS